MDSNSVSIDDFYIQQTPIKNSQRTDEREIVVKRLLSRGFTVRQIARLAFGLSEDEDQLRQRFGDSYAVISLNGTSRLLEWKAQMANVERICRELAEELK